MNNIYNKIRNSISYFSTYNHFNKIEIKSIEETLDEIYLERKSIGRFGDGEFKWIIMKDQDSFQKNSKRLSEKLLEVLNSDLDGFLVGLPNQFNNLRHQTIKSKLFWINTIGGIGKEILSMLNDKKVYYSAIISRIYIGIENKKKTEILIQKWKKIFYGRDILIVEGNKTRFGYGNDLLEGASSIKRIECPNENAFFYYDEILNDTVEILEEKKDALVIIALGPTATILSYELFKKGFQSIDIGHLDIEFEWYKMKANNKTTVKNKYVNEVENGKENIDELNDKSYTDEIIKNISEKNKQS